MKRRNNKKGNKIVRGMVSMTITVAIGAAIILGSLSDDTKMSNIESEINSSIERVSMFISKGDTYSAKLVLNEDILNRYDELPESVVSGVENLCDTLNVKR